MSDLGLRLGSFGVPALVIVCGIAVAIVSCTTLPPSERSSRGTIAEEWHLQRMIVLERPPLIAIDGPRDLSGLDQARLAAKRADPEILSSRIQARFVGIDALPYLIGSAEGRAFLQAPGPRAIARGRPAQSCPATAVIARTQPTPRDVLAAEALNACAAKLPTTGEGCGCQIVAIDSLVTVPREELNYATGSTARLSIPSQGIDRLMVAEEVPDGPLLLRDLTGPVGSVEMTGDETVSIRFENGDIYTGRRIKVGFRRGRLAERIYASNAEGRRLSLLIGFEPDELAREAAAWLAWPKEG